MGGATLVGALEIDTGVAAFAAGAAGGGGRRRGAAFGAAFLPDTAELISVDIAAVIVANFEFVVAFRRDCGRFKSGYVGGSAGHGNICLTHRQAEFSA